MLGGGESTVRLRFGEASISRSLLNQLEEPKTRSLRNLQQKPRWFPLVTGPCCSNSTPMPCVTRRALPPGRLRGTLKRLGRKRPRALGGRRRAWDLGERRLKLTGEGEELFQRKHHKWSKDIWAVFGGISTLELEICGALGRLRLQSFLPKIWVKSFWYLAVWDDEYLSSLLFSLGLCRVHDGQSSPLESQVGKVEEFQET